MQYSNFLSSYTSLSLRSSSSFIQLIHITISLTFLTICLTHPPPRRVLFPCPCCWARTPVCHLKPPSIFAMTLHCHCPNRQRDPICDFCIGQYKAATLYIKQVKERRRLIASEFLDTLARGLHNFPHIVQWFLCAKAELNGGVAVKTVTQHLVNDSDIAWILMSLRDDDNRLVPSVEMCPVCHSTDNENRSIGMAAAVAACWCATTGISTNGHGNDTDYAACHER